jgi:hypothetical protein
MKVRADRRPLIGNLTNPADAEPFGEDELFF